MPLKSFQALKEWNPAAGYLGASPSTDYHPPATTHPGIRTALASPQIRPAAFQSSMRFKMPIPLA